MHTMSLIQLISTTLIFGIDFLPLPVLLPLVFAAVGLFVFVCSAVVVVVVTHYLLLWAAYIYRKPLRIW